MPLWHYVHMLENVINLEDKLRYYFRKLSLLLACGRKTKIIYRNNQ